VEKRNKTGVRRILKKARTILISCNEGAKNGPSPHGAAAMAKWDCEAKIIADSRADNHNFVASYGELSCV
jgi:hypothetical protein